MVKFKTVTLRLPEYAYHLLKDQAGITKRSMNRMAEVMIEEYCAQHMKLYPVGSSPRPALPAEAPSGDESDPFYEFADRCDRLGRVPND